MTASQAPRHHPSARDQPLAGRRAWLITDGKIGMDVQVRGVAEALGVDYEFKHVTPNGVWKMLAPWGPVPAADHPRRRDSAFAAPWPDLAIATGRASIPYIRALKKAAGPALFTVVIQDPKTGAKTADLIAVPAHDKLHGANVVKTLTAPHSFTQSRLASLRQAMPPEIAALRAPRVAVILGGPNSAYRFTPQSDARLAEALASLAQLGASFLITPSRRTHASLLTAVDAATAHTPRIFWDGSGINPYPQFLAHADAFVVTADSVNMTGECCASSRPVFVFAPSPGSPKFRRFHDALQDYGATRPLPTSFDSWSQWHYMPLDAASAIAAQIAERFARRRAMLA